MSRGIIDIKFDNELVSLFIHKPYNFKKETVSIEEKQRQFKEIEIETNNSFGRIVGTEQTHSNNVIVIDENNIDKEFSDVDGLLTNLNNVSLITYVADCQGILLYDTNKKVIGNIHSGWKGTLTRISTNAINLMISKFNSNVEDVKVYISPSIHKCCFEVDEDLKNQFENEFNDIDLDDIFIKGEIKEGKQKYFIDTAEINKRVLINLGIKKENIESSELCSMCNSEIIHSYRKDKPNDGRNILLIKKTTN